MARQYTAALSQYCEASWSTLSLPLTLACWWMTDTTDSFWRIIFGVTQHDQNYYGYVLGTKSVSQALACMVRNDNGQARSETSTGAFGTGEWHHSMGVFTSGSSRQLWFDASAQTEDTTLRNEETQSVITVGAVAGNSTHKFYWDGRVCEAAAWNVALGQAEADQLYAGVSPLLIRPNNLIRYFPLIRGDIDILDADLTPYGSPTVAVHVPKVKPYWWMPAWAMKPSVAPIQIPRHPAAYFDGPTIF